MGSRGSREPGGVRAGKAFPRFPKGIPMETTPSPSGSSFYCEDFLLEIRPVRKHSQYFLKENDSAGEIFPRIWAPGDAPRPAQYCEILRNMKEYQGILSDGLQGTHRAGRSRGGGSIYEVA